MKRRMPPTAYEAAPIERRRALWQLLTEGRYDGLTYRVIMRRLGYKTTDTVRNDLNVLETAGYIRRRHNADAAITVLVPFVSQGIDHDT